MKLTHLSLFSGIGGLDIAAEMAGFETVGQCEWADYPTKVLEKHWPGLPRWRDIRTLTGEDFYAKTGLRTVDIISGGFPCQPFSLAGQRRGQADDRYLWPQMLRVVSELRPTWVVGENVAGLVSMVQPSAAARVESRIINRQPDEDFYEAVLSRQEDYLLLQLIGDLERIGYEVQPLIIPACAVGAAHRRDRLALIAHSNCDTGRAWWTEPERQQRAAGTTSGGSAMAYTSGIRREGNRELGTRERMGQKKDCAHIAKGGKDVGGDTNCDHAAEECGIRVRENAESGGTGENVPNADGNGQQSNFSHQTSVGRDPDQIDTAIPKDSDVSHAEIPERKGERRETRWRRAEPGRGGGRTAQPGLGGVVDGIPSWMDRYWLTEPDIPRVASGVEGRVDKLKALGNAVYWRQFYPIFAGIYHIEEGQP